MIIALVAILLGGGGGGNIDMWSFPTNFKDQVQIIIIDKDRQKTVVNLYEEMEKTVEDHNAEMEDLSKSLWEALDNHDAKNSELMGSVPSNFIFSSSS